MQCIFVGGYSEGKSAHTDSLSLSLALFHPLALKWNVTYLSEAIFPDKIRMYGLQSLHIDSNQQHMGTVTKHHNTLSIEVLFP